MSDSEISIFDEIITSDSETDSHSTVSVENANNVVELVQTSTAYSEQSVVSKKKWVPLNPQPLTKPGVFKYLYNAKLSKYESEHITCKAKSMYLP